MRLATTAALIVATSWSGALAQTNEEAGVRQALNYYLQGQATGNGDFYRKAFHPDAKLIFIRDGKVAQMTSEEFASGASGKAAADEAQRKRFIESIDIAGNAAIAKIRLDYPSVKFVDYMTLLKVGSEWKIVNKSFHAARP